MNKIILTTLTVAILFGGVISCKKKTTEDPAPTTDSQVTQSSDAKLSSDASNQLLDDVNNGLSDQSAARLLPNSATATMTANKDTLTIIFSGDNAAGTYSRYGKIVARLSSPSTARWFDVGAQWIVDIQAVKVTRKSTGSSVIITGSKTITNVSGGRVVDVITSGTAVTHTITGDMLLSFDNGTARTWHISRQRTFERNADNTLKITISGTSTDGTYSNISEVGTNRFGSAFVTTIDTPVIISNCSGTYKVIQGITTHHKIGKDITVTYGLNSAGTLVNSCDANTFKINYTKVTGEAAVTYVTY